MKTKLVTETVRETDFSNIEKLIESLNAIRANHNGDIKARLSGCEEFGYKIVCTYRRSLTEEELRSDEENTKRAEEAALRLRREEYERLKKEFERD
jgi:hypothetical protein